MKLPFLAVAVGLALAACASHPPRCGGRLTPINRPASAPGASAPGRRPHARAAKAVHP